MVEFNLNGQTYRAGKLDAFKQFHLSRKLAPIVPTLIPVFVKLSRDGDLAKDIAGIAAIVQPFADGIAAMTDADSEYVLSTCLGAVQRSTGQNTWAPIWSQAAKSCMFDDIDLGVMVQLVMQVVQDSLGPFIRGLLMSQQGSPE